MLRTVGERASVEPWDLAQVFGVFDADNLTTRQSHQPGLANRQTGRPVLRLVVAIKVVDVRKQLDEVVE